MLENRFPNIKVIESGVKQLKSEEHVREFFFLMTFRFLHLGEVFACLPLSPAVTPPKSLASKF